MTVSDVPPPLAALEPNLLEIYIEKLFWDSLLSSDADREKITKLRSDVWDLAYAFDYGVKEPARMYRALRIMIGRFGKEGSRFLISLTNPKADMGIILEVRHRQTRDLTAAGRRKQTRMKQELADSKLAMCVHRHEHAGLSRSDAIDAATVELGRVSRGREGAKRALGRAKKASDARGYVDPLDADIFERIGLNAMVAMRTQDFPHRGRPRKSDK